MEFLLAFAASVILMSFVEHTIHRWHSHKRPLPELAYRSIPYLEGVYHEHAKLHHQHYYEVFDHEPDPYGRDLNITLNVWLGGLIALICCVGFWFVWPVFAAVFFFTVIGHHLTWNLIHAEMHKPSGRLFARTFIYKFLARYHWMHHAYPGKNYNVVFPLADYLTGTHLSPRSCDQARMKKMGLY
jgi:hypothetical protein